MAMKNILAKRLVKIAEELAANSNSSSYVAEIEMLRARFHKVFEKFNAAVEEATKRSKEALAEYDKMSGEGGLEDNFRELTNMVELVVDLVKEAQSSFDGFEVTNDVFPDFRELEEATNEIIAAENRWRDIGAALNDTFKDYKMRSNKMLMCLTDMSEPAVMLERMKVLLIEAAEEASDEAARRYHPKMLSRNSSTRVIERTAAKSRIAGEYEVPKEFVDAVYNIGDMAGWYVVTFEDFLSKAEEVSDYIKSFAEWSKLSKTIKVGELPVAIRDRGYQIYDVVNKLNVQMVEMGDDDALDDYDSLRDYVTAALPLGEQTLAAVRDAQNFMNEVYDKIYSRIEEMYDVDGWNSVKDFASKFENRAHKCDSIAKKVERAGATLQSMANRLSNQIDRQEKEFSSIED